jgi:hypothetical protein
VRIFRAHVWRGDEGRHMFKLPKGVRHSSHALCWQSKARHTTQECGLLPREERASSCCGPLRLPVRQPRRDH